MISSAIYLGAIGIGLIFLPDEIVSTLGIVSNPTTTIVFQLLGALYFGFAMINWMSKGNMIGGIYNKPIAVGNFTHFAVGAFALVKAAIKFQDGVALFLITGIYLLFAIIFAYVSRNNPRSLDKKNDT